MRKIMITGVIMICVLFGLNHYVMANEKSVNYKKIVKEAFHTQVALSEKERSLNEVKEMLNIYFTKDFISLFLKENLVKTDNGYQTFGSDFPLYYVPFFSYDDTTIVKKVGNKIYVFENLSKKDSGPVLYKSNYQGVRLTKVKDAWKIDEILYTVPNNIIHTASVKKSSTHKVNGVQLEKLHVVSYFLNSFTSFILPANMKPFWFLISKL